MTLEDIERLIDAAAATGTEATVSLAGCTLVLRPGGPVASPVPAAAAAPRPMLRAPAAGVFRPAHPALFAPGPGRTVAAGEAVAFLEVGPCLLPVVAPTACRPGPALVADGTLVGFGTALLPMEPPA